MEAKFEPRMKTVPDLPPSPYYIYKYRKNSTQNGTLVNVVNKSCQNKCIETEGQIVKRNALPL